MVLYGLRGVGKTVLLTRLRHDAENRNWIVAQVEASGDANLRELLGEALYSPLADLSRPSAGKRLLRALKTALSFKASYDSAGVWNFGVDLNAVAGGGADTGVLSTDLRKIIKDLSLAAQEQGSGLAILVDEAQDLAATELSALAEAAQAAATDDWPFLLGLAGLPSLPQVLSDAKSYTERYRYEAIEKLTSEEATRALKEPANAKDIQWDDDAAEHVVAESGRYPYFIQQFGQDTWELATGGPIDLGDAKQGVLKGLNQLDAGFFRARWDRATKKEKEYLRAMCPEGDSGIGSGEVATRLKRKSTSLGPTRASLIHKGLIYAPEHGVVQFTVPGMAAFVSRQPM